MKSKTIDLSKFGFLIDDGQRKYYANSKKILLNVRAAEALENVKAALGDGFNLKIKDGLRVYSEQKRIVEMAEEQFKRTNPGNWESLVEIYTGGYEQLKLNKFVFMDHRSGDAVDLTIVRGKEELDMGGVKHEECDKLDFFEKKRNLTKKQKEIRDNRRLLKKVMKKAGFRSYPMEWWHWGFLGG